MSGRYVAAPKFWNLDGGRAYDVTNIGGRPTDPQRDVRSSRSYWLSDTSTRYFGDIFHYTFDDTCDAQTPRFIHECGDAGNWIRNDSSGSIHSGGGGDGNINVGRTGSSWHNEMPMMNSTHRESTSMLSLSPFSDNNSNIITTTLSPISPIAQITSDMNTLNTRQPDWLFPPTASGNSSISYESYNQQRQSRHRCPKTTCSFTFGRKSDLERHFRTIHCGRFSYSCGVVGCDNNKGRGYSRVDKLREHMWRKHVGRRTGGGIREDNSLLG